MHRNRYRILSICLAVLMVFSGVSTNTLYAQAVQTQDVQDTSAGTEQTQNDQDTPDASDGQVNPVDVTEEIETTDPSDATDEVNPDEANEPDTTGDSEEQTTDEPSAEEPSEEYPSAAVEEEVLPTEDEASSSVEEVTEEITEETGEDGEEPQIFTAQVEVSGIYQNGDFTVANEGVQTSGRRRAAARTVTAQQQLTEDIYNGILTSAESIDTSAYGFSINTVMSLYCAVINDHPELFYATTSIRYSYYLVDGVEIVAKIWPGYIDGLDTVEAKAAFQEAVDEALSIVDDDMTDLQKAIAFHDYLALNSEYDYDNLKNNTVPQTSYSAYGALVKKIVVCQGYALAYKYLCNSVGIDCYMVTSDAMNHAWNLIVLDGKYYQVDVTWDDPTADRLGRVTHSYMFLSDAELQARSHYSWQVTSGSDVVSLEATDTTYDNYFWNNCQTPLLIIDGQYYYSEYSGYNVYIKKYDGINTTTLTSNGIGLWYAWNSSGYWPGAYADLFYLDGRIYYNTKNAIRSITLTGTDDREEYSLDAQSQAAGGYVYGMRLQNDIIQYIFLASPNNSTKDIYRLSLSDLASTPSLAAQLAVPGFAPEAGHYAGAGSQYTIDRGSTVTLTAAEGAAIYYTTDGSTPSVDAATDVSDGETDETAGSDAGKGTHRYTGPITISENTTIKAIAVQEGYRNSNVTTATFIACDNSLVLKQKVTLTEGTYTLLSDVVETLPTGTSLGSLTWAVSDQKMLWLYGNSSIIARSGYDGTATLTATAKDHKGTVVTATCEVVVKPCTYTVTYVDWNGRILYHQEVEARRDVVIPDNLKNLTRWGYTFTGWKGNTTHITKNETLTAQYEINTYNITYVTDGGINDKDNPSAFTVETPDITLKDAGYRPGYIFNGWYADPQDENTVDQEEDRITTIKEGAYDRDLTLYAHWISIKSAEGLWIDVIEDQTYTGQTIEPEIQVYNGTELLTDKDYTVSYKNNTKVNTDYTSSSIATVIVKGKGNYSGTAEATFLILPKSIDEGRTDVQARTTTLKALTAGQKPDVTLTVNQRKLKKGRDYTLTYYQGEDQVEELVTAGSYQIKITGMGSYTGERMVDIELTDAMLIADTTASAVKTQTYTGEELKPAVTLRDGKTILTAGKDYELTYKDNINPGTATIVVTGKGDYAGEKEITFRILGISLSQATVSDLPEYTYTGTAIEPVCTVTAIKNGAAYTLVQDQDYTVTYRNNTKAGTAYITIKGIGGFAGTLTRSFRINKAQLDSNNDAVKLNKTALNDSTHLTAEYTKGGAKITPVLTLGDQVLKQGVDYTVRYENNGKVGEEGTMIITGKGGLTGSIRLTYTITEKDLGGQDSGVTITAADKIYRDTTGNYTTTLKLTDSNGKALKAGVDYDKNDITYTYTRTITGENGEQTTEEVELKKGDKIPTGTVVTVTVKGIGNYTGTITTSYRIVEKDIRYAVVTVTPQTYNGKAVELKKSDITVKLRGTTLSSSDYEIIGYTNNTKTGIATVTIKGTTDTYGGTKTVRFTIKPAKVSWWWTTRGQQ